MASELRLVLVTPETTLLDQPVLGLNFPLFDGQVGILPGRAPIVGRLGTGELKISESGATTSFFIDGGFVQIKGPVVSLLTNQAIPLEAVDSEAAAELLQEAQQRKPTTDEEFTEKDRDLDRARRMLAVSKKPR